MDPNPSRPLKIALLKRYLGPYGGLEKYTRYLANAFAKRGHEVSFLCAESSEDQSIDKAIEIVRLNTSSFSIFRKIQSFDRACQDWLRKRSYDIVFGMDRTSHQTHLRAGNGVHRAFLERRKTIDPWLKRKTYFLNPTHKTILDLEKSSFENPHLKKIFTNSHMVKKEILEFYSIHPGKIEVIHNGVEYSELQPYFDSWTDTQEELQKELRIDKKVHIFLFIGNGYMRKGLMPLMKALSRIHQMPFHLIVLGKERNLSFYRKVARSLHLENRISFLGAQPSPFKYYALADTMVIPSFYDPFANVTVEALAMGLFVLSSQMNGGHEILSNTNGEVIQSLYDIDSFAEQLKTRLNMKKTPESALAIRTSISHLDFSIQLNTMIESCLK